MLQIQGRSRSLADWPEGWKHIVKAVIMAGGEGTRLRPLSLGMPKPMVPLLGRPVMEHIIGLLKRHGIDEIAVTLCYMPEAVQSYFGDGQKWGVRLHYFIEEAPLGTAGSVRACAPFLEGEDFLVISGDSVCDLDLTAAMEFHQAKRAQATLVLFRHPAPLEYGLVLIDEEQRVVRFVEKPSWGQVVTDLVNTGIYLPPRCWSRSLRQALGFWKRMCSQPCWSPAWPVRRPRRQLLVRHGGLRGLSGLCGGRPLWEGKAGYGPASAVPRRLERPAHPRGCHRDPALLAGPGAGGAGRPDRPPYRAGAEQLGGTPQPGPAVGAPPRRPGGGADHPLRSHPLQGGRRPAGGRPQRGDRPW